MLSLAGVLSSVSCDACVARALRIVPCSLVDVSATRVRTPVPRDYGILTPLVSEHGATSPWDVA